MWIIKHMQPKRPHKMTVMLSDQEKDFREAIEKRLGTDGSSVMRNALIDLGLKLGYTFPLPAKIKPARRSRP